MQIYTYIQKEQPQATATILPAKDNHTCMYLPHDSYVHIHMTLFLMYKNMRQHVCLCICLHIKTMSGLYVRMYRSLPFSENNRTTPWFRNIGQVFQTQSADFSEICSRLFKAYLGFFSSNYAAPKQEKADVCIFRLGINACGLGPRAYKGFWPMGFDFGIGGLGYMTLQVWCKCMGFRVQGSLWFRVQRDVHFQAWCECMGFGFRAHADEFLRLIHLKTPMLVFEQSGCYF